MSETPVNFRAVIREKDAEIEYLRGRNLALSGAVDDLSDRVVALTTQLEALQPTQDGAQIPEVEFSESRPVKKKGG